MENERKTAGVYIRVSTEDQAYINFESILSELSIMFDGRI